MRKRRITWFLVSIGLGIALGLLYGWVLRPVPYQDVPMDTLRQDFRTDYILMVAQAYTLDHDAALAQGLQEYVPPLRGQP